MKVNVYLPCRKKSSRVKNKNIRKFANINFGLLEIKINQLVNAKQVNTIYLSTNDKKIINYFKKLNEKKIKIHERKDHSLSLNKTTNNQLLNNAIDIMPDEHILWTHVTSPSLIKTYDKAILKYKKLIKSKRDFNKG